MAQIISLGKVTVTTGGTPVQLASTQVAAHKIVIQAWPANTGRMWIGMAGLTKASGASVLQTLSAPAVGETVFELQSISGSDLDPSKLWIDADTNGEAVTGFIVVK